MMAERLRMTIEWLRNMLPWNKGEEEMKVERLTEMDQYHIDFLQKAAAMDADCLYKAAAVLVDNKHHPLIKSESHLKDKYKYGCGRACSACDFISAKSNTSDPMSEIAEDALKHNLRLDGMTLYLVEQYQYDTVEYPQGVLVSLNDISVMELASLGLRYICTPQSKVEINSNEGLEDTKAKLDKVTKEMDKLVSSKKDDNSNKACTNADSSTEFVNALLAYIEQVLGVPVMYDGRYREVSAVMFDIAYALNKRLRGWTP